MSASIRAMPRVQPARPRRRRGRVLLPVLLAILAIVAVATPGTVNLLVSYWWFQELGYGSVFTTQLGAGIALGVAGAVAAFVVLKALSFFVTRVARTQGRGQAYRGLVRLGVNAAILALAIIAGLILSGDWQRVLFALHQVPFGVSDPVFHHDVSFYVFTLPLLQDLLGWLGGVMVVGLLVGLALLYALDLGGRINAMLEPYVRTGQVVGGPDFDLRWLRPYLTVVSFWLALLALVVAASNWLIRYVSVVTPGNGFQGASYVDLNAGIPGWTILTVLGVLGALVLLVNAFIWRRWAVVGGAIVAWLVAWVALVLLYPGLLQGLKVNPAPLAAETPQITHNIDATRAAFDLSGVTTAQFPVNPITPAQVQAGRAGIDSLLVENPQPFKDAALQQQAIRTFYDFPRIGVDRYRIGGQVRQVLIAPRELQQSQLPDTAQTWQNLNFTYTHGYGLIVAPVNDTTSTGNPLYLIKDIPPRRDTSIPGASDLPAVTRPQIYYGLDTTTPVYVRAGAGANEFDYGAGDQSYTYTGTGGISIGGFFKRLVWVVYFASPIQVGTTGYLTPTSRVLLHRDIRDRLTTLAPFFTYDSDPYMVLDHAGRPIWIVDGYTTSTDYPYAEPYGGATVAGLGGVNYIRNAVKATIDPYNGTVRLYVSDPGDPLARTVGQSFPGLLQPLSAMPADLRAHVRYPEDLFSVQSDVYARYHQTDAQTWYNNNDQWAIPTVHDATANQDNTTLPYYAVTRLPGSATNTDEFVLARSYDPLNKNNLVSLLVGRSDAPHYGQLVSYQFPLGQQVLGPQQLQANVQQQPTFSGQISLWDQTGSSVQYGAIIIVPVGQGLLYLEPLYLQAANSKIPQLTKVIAYANGKLVWGNSIEDALSQIFGNAVPPPIAKGPTPAPGPPPGSGGGAPALTGAARQVIGQIQAHLQAAQADFGRGDYTGYAREQVIVRQLIKSALGQSQSR